LSFSEICVDFLVELHSNCTQEHQYKCYIRWAGKAMCRIASQNF